jgi:2-oxoisovalerate dehydrogenase E1 component alpha subunit
MGYEIRRAIQEDGSPIKGADPELSDKKLIEMYRTMRTVRTMNERGMKLQRQGRINFFVGSLGQEAVHTGAGAALAEDDWYFPHYRDPGVALLRGASLESMVHQMYGNAEDPIKGRQMPNHYSYDDQNFVSISSPISSHVPSAVGAAYAAKIQGDDVVTMASFGDGSTSEGEFHSGMNFAGAWETPTVFLCQNNGYAISVPVEKQTASETFAQKAEAYGFEGVRVDGNDILAVYDAAREAVEKAREGGGPTLVEAVTFRMGPHSSSDDPDKYVPEEMFDEWADKDPLDRFEEYLRKRGVLDEEDVERIQKEIDDEWEAAVDAAEEAGPPDHEDIFDEVYADMPWHVQEQYDELQRFVGDD